MEFTAVVWDRIASCDFEIDPWIFDRCAQRLADDCLEQPTSRLIDVNVASDRAAEDLERALALIRRSLID